MPKWAADYSLAVEADKQVLNLVLDKYLDEFRNNPGGNLLQYSGSLGFLGSFNVELKDLEIQDMEDVPPVGGGVVTDLQARVDFLLRLFGRTVNTFMLFTIEDVGIDMPKTPAGLPIGIALSITPSLNVTITFPNVTGIFGWILNRFIGPLISTGVWLAFRLIRKVEIPIWQIVDIFAALGLRFTSGSPLLTTQKTVPPSSLLLASDFNLTNTLLGNPNQLKHFLPASTNIGAVIHERVVAAAVQIAFMKGWVPSRFRVRSWRVSIRYFGVRFEQDKIVAFGNIKAKRRRWIFFKVKVRIIFSIAVIPKVVDTNTPKPKIAFRYDADIRTHISTSGMLVIIGVLMFAPLFMALTLTMSFVFNFMLNKFLPFSTSWKQSGLNLIVQASSAKFSGFVPFSMKFPMQLTGQGTYELDRFQNFQLPGGAKVQVDYKPESLSVQDKELRLAVNLK